MTDSGVTGNEPAGISRPGPAASAPPRLRVAGAEVQWQTLPELLQWAATLPVDRGVEIDGQFQSYAEIDRCSRLVAANLRHLGVKPGDHVCTLMSNRAEVLPAWFGTVMAGAIWVPLNTGVVGQDLLHVLTDAMPVAVIVDTEHVETLESQGVGETCPALRFLIGMPMGSTKPGWKPYQDLLVPGRASINLRLTPGDPAVIIYTGGTTGLPKGVVLPHFAMICGGIRYGEAFAATSQDRHFGVSPLYHAGGLTISVLGPMIAGMTSTVERSFSLSNYWRRVRESGATIINPIGVILTLLCRQAASAADRDHAVRACIGVTGQLPEGIPAEFSRRFGIRIVNIYALTEASGAMIVYNTLDSPRPDANGRASHWVDIAVHDTSGQPLPPNQIGTIVLRPKIPYTFMLGYHNNDAATLKVLSNLWLHTGDLGMLDEDGYLHFCGREAHWVRRRGENISAYEVEGIISQFPGIAELCLVGVPADIGEEEVKAFIVTEPGIRIDPVELDHWCAQRMAGFKVPRFVEFVESLPRSAAKREPERYKLRAMPNDAAWDREKVLGRRAPATKGRGIK